MEYNFREIEQKWQERWKETNAYKVPNISEKEKFYVLDMFPYPSGAGLHVGHPLGYIASDIYSRYKRLKGYNVLHPMGYDAFGLPAEQYAIEHGVHPAVSTSQNISNFRSQLDKIGFSYDWDREVRTSEPNYYEWTQWIFLQLFKSFYNRQTQKAEPIDSLFQAFENDGNANHPMSNGQFYSSFNAAEWNAFTEKEQQDILMEYRLAYCGYGEVNWCEALGTVLANDEVVNGVSERGGYPVVKKKLRQWYLRITEYADRLLDGLNRIEFSESMKEMQANWIGKSYGANVTFKIAGSTELLEVYTTRPDTIFGVDFMVVAPENEIVEKIKIGEHIAAVDEYVAYVKSRSERERQAEKKISGCFTGAYAINPFNGREIPVWISEYVLAGYGTGAIMAVPCGDERDFKFANHFGIPITNIIGDAFNGKEANPTKDAILQNSDFLNGLVMKNAIEVVNNKLEELGIGKKKINYKMRDAAFSRQRYWGEPFPIVWKDGIAYPADESELPLELPVVETYSPGPEGEGPLANIPSWTAKQLETNTMPGYAGSSWYFLRYMDPHNDQSFCDRRFSDYWNQVDLYVGGTEHAVGHLLYSRLWTKALYDLGHIGFDEPFKKLLNQGMIQGSSRLVYRLKRDYSTVDQIIDKSDRPLIFISHNIQQGIQDKDIDIKTQLNDTVQFALNMLFNSEGKVRFTGNYNEADKVHVNVNIVDGIELDVFKYIGERKLKSSVFIYDDFSILTQKEDSIQQVGSGKFLCDSEVEKMSKSKLNAVNPDDLVEKFGADTFRMYEMFLGPVEQSKPWDTKGIEGVHRFLKKLWRLFYDENKLIVTNDAPNAAELKVLHKTIKKIEEDTERYSFNTAVSSFMIAVNELSDLKSHKRAILEPLAIMLTPYAPHIAEELYHRLGNTTSVLDASFPVYNASYTAESSKEYPVSINGKLRTTMQVSLDAEQAEVETMVMQNELVKRWIEDKPIKKFIFVKGKMINVVV
jgi:leucyl-tRNA synthetase